MPLNWSNTQKEAQLSGIKALVYGVAGAGKTRLCATNPNSVIISAESGLLTLRDVKIPVIKINSLEGLNDAYQFFASSHEAKQFQGINLDSISEIAEVILAAAKATVKDPRQAYGEVIEKTLKLVRAFRDLPGYNFLCAAKMESVKDEVTGGVKFGPSMPGSKLGNQLPYFFDEVFHLGIGKDQQTGQPFRYLQTQPDIQYVAKDRSNCLSMYETPDFGAILTKILSGVPQHVA